MQAQPATGPAATWRVAAAATHAHRAAGKSWPCHRRCAVEADAVGKRACDLRAGTRGLCSTRASCTRDIACQTAYLLSALTRPCAMQRPPAPVQGQHFHEPLEAPDSRPAKRGRGAGPQGRGASPGDETGKLQHALVVLCDCPRGRVRRAACLLAPAGVPVPARRPGARLGTRGMGRMQVGDAGQPTVAQPRTLLAVQGCCLSGEASKAPPTCTSCSPWEGAAQAGGRPTCTSCQPSRRLRRCHAPRPGRPCRVGRVRAVPRRLVSGAAHSAGHGRVQACQPCLCPSSAAQGAAADAWGAQAERRSSCCSRRHSRTRRSWAPGLRRPAAGPSAPGLPCQGPGPHPDRHLGAPMATRLTHPCRSPMAPRCLTLAEVRGTGLASSGSSAPCRL